MADQLGLSRRTGSSCGSPGSGDVVFDLRSNGAITLGVAHAEQGVALLDLLIIQKGLIRLIHTAGEHQSRAGAAGPSPAGIGQIHSLLLGGIENVGIVPAGEALSRFDGDGVSRHSQAINSDVNHGQRPEFKTVAQNTGWGHPHQRGPSRLGTVGKPAGLPAAALGAVTHLLPNILPFLSPLEGALAHRADFGGPIGVMGHGAR